MKPRLRTPSGVATATGISSLLLVSPALGVSATKSYKLSATLSAAQQVPRPSRAGNGVGVFAATITQPLPGSPQQTWGVVFNLAWSHLSSPVTEVEIHFGKSGQSGPDASTVLCWVVTGPPCVSGLKGVAVEMPPPTATAIVRGVATYIEVNTKKNPKGEIRGQIKVNG